MCQTKLPKKINFPNKIQGKTLKRQNSEEASQNKNQDILRFLNESKTKHFTLWFLGKEELRNSSSCTIESLFYV